MRSSIFFCPAAALLLVVPAASAFVPLHHQHHLQRTAHCRRPQSVYCSSSTTGAIASTALHAVPVLVRKAKLAQLKQHVADGVPPTVLTAYQDMKAKMQDDDDLPIATTVGPLQEALTRRAGTLTVLAEYKRQFVAHGADDDDANIVYDPERLSPIFREYGAAAIAVTTTDARSNNSYADLEAFVEEQRRARMQVPGPVLVVNNDLILDELQVARTKVSGAAGLVLDLDFINDKEDLRTLLKAAAACELECIVNVSTAGQAQQAVNAGARILCVVRVEAVKDKVAVISNLQIPELQQPICKIASIAATQSTKSLSEIEQAWAVRDKGFQCAWVGEVLYKNAGSAGEHPGAIIKACISKSSLKWASPKAASGRGEGAREYLGDIMM